MTNYLIDAATLAGIFTIAGLGLYVLTALCGQISVAQATFMGLGALVSSYCARSSLATSNSLAGKGLAFPQSLVIAMVVTAVVSAFFGAMCARLRGANAIAGSIAVSIVVIYLCERMTFLSGGSKGAPSSKSLAFGNTDFSHLEVGSKTFSPQAGLLMLVMLLLIATFIYTYNVSRSPLSRAMRMVRERDSAAQTCAISPTKTVVSAHFFCGLTAGVAGTLYAHYLGSMEMSSSNPWLGAFGLIASIQLLAYLVVSGMKKLEISTVVLFVLPFLATFFAKEASSWELFDTTQGSRFSPGAITALVSCVIVVGLIHFSARLRKSKM